METYIIDVSRHQIKPENSVSLKRAKDEGILAVIIRATVGDYYSDPRTHDFYRAAKQEGLAATFYHVMTPERSILGQMNRFFKHIDGLAYDFPLVLDNELWRNQLNSKITHVVWSCFTTMEEESGSKPFNYTRQSWWDHWVNPWDKWKQYPLIAARYTSYENPTLTSPWSDGKFKFRDYDDWWAWQWSADRPPNNQGANYGFDSNDIDLDAFNGTKDELIAYLGGTSPPSTPPTLEERMEKLETCCRSLGCAI